MSALVRHPWRLALLVSAALGTGYLVLRDHATGPPATGPASLGPGYYVKQARLIGTGTDGRILYEITTAEVLQAMTGGLITMRDVDVDYQPPAQPPWQLHADRGHMPADRNMITLEGDVVATSTSAAAGRAAEPLVIRTDQLELDPEAYVASTEHPVVVERDRDTLRARGMRVFFKQDRLQFNADVHARFLP